MKRDYVSTSIFVLSLITLATVLAEDYMFGMEVPLIIIGLGFMLFAALKRIRDRKREAENNKRESDRHN